MVHHPVSCSQNSRYLHSGSSNRIDFAEGVRLFFLCSRRKVLLNHQCPVPNDSPLPVGPMTCFAHRRTVRYDLTSEHSELQQLQYMKHNMPACHPPCLSRRGCGINVALPTHFNSDEFVSCQSDLWVLAVQFVPQRFDWWNRGGWNANFMPCHFPMTQYVWKAPSYWVAEDLKCKKWPDS